MFRPAIRSISCFLLAVGLTSSLAAGCGRYQVETGSRLDQLDRDLPPTLAITPPRLLMEHQPHQVFQYALDLIDVLQVEHEIPVIAPWEYDPTGELAAAGSHQQTLLALAELSAVQVVDVALLDFRIEERRTERAVAVPAHMGGGVERQYDAELTVTLTLRGFPYGEELAWVALTFEDDPLSREATAANPRPVVRDGVRRAADELARLIEARWDGDFPGEVPDLELLFNPRQMFDYEGGAGESLSSQLGTTDELDRMANRLVYYQYFDPEISGAELRLFERSPPGLLVRSLGDEAERDGQLGLRAGDFITQVEGEPVAGPQSLMRPFLLTPVGQEVSVQLIRDGQSRRLRLPVRPGE